MGRNCHRCPYTGGCWPECKLPSATWATNRTDATPASNGEAAGAVNAEMLAALEHARHKMWEYGFSEDDLAPVREAIAKAEHGRVSVGLNDELLVAAWLCTKRDNGHSILRFTQPKDHKQWTFRPLFLGGRDDHG